MCVCVCVCGVHTWVAVGVLNPEWHSHKMEVTVYRHFVAEAMPGGRGGRVSHALSLHCILAFASQLRKHHRKTSVRVARKC